MVRANIDRCGSELSERDLVSLRARYEMPSSLVMHRPKATERANAPPPKLRSIFVVALKNGLCLPVHQYVGDVLSIAGIRPAQLSPNMRISITGFYSACLLTGITPITEFFLTSLSHRTQKDDFLYFVVKPKIKDFCEAILSKVDPESWRPFFFYVSGEGLPIHVPAWFTLHLKSIATGLTPGSDADLGGLEALKATYNVSDHALPPPPAVPATSSVQQPLNRGGEQLFRGGRGDRPSLVKRETSLLFPSSLQGKAKGSLPPIDLVYAATPTLVGDHSTTVVSEPEDHGEVGSAAPQAITPSPLPVLIAQASRLSTSPSEGFPASRKRMGSPPANPPLVQSQRRSDKAPLSQSPISPTKDSLASRESPSNPSHEELTFSFSTLGDKKRYATSVRRTKAVRTELEGVQVERDSAQLEKDALRKDR
ncbi:hypothetical protein LIER_14354 [Lithospermum erythrorhizon]|uniref:Transposase (putative) gypsy type domain-containing protein n=1 Tax=Lithospermum erythrorhizon TaxID=34254 RepID=A0AAV3PYU8_LITER